MSYLPHLDLVREPFALSAHPDFLLLNDQAGEILNALEIAVLLRRGAMVCLGGAGMGKTMLCRALIQRLEGRSDLRVFVLDSFSGEPTDFLRVLHGSVVGGVPESGSGPRLILEAIQARIRHLAGNEGERNLVLCVDEGQRLSVPALEVLRELLNLECAAGKLLQIVIFAHPALESALERHPSFSEQVMERFRLAVLTREETRMLIRHRLAVAGGRHDLFTNAACDGIHAAARGVPRRIVHLAHKSLLTLVARNQDRVTRRTVTSIVREQEGSVQFLPRLALGLIVLVVLLVLGTSLGRPPSTAFEAPSMTESVLVQMNGPMLRSPVAAPGPRGGPDEELDLSGEEEQGILGLAPGLDSGLDRDLDPGLDQEPVLDLDLGSDLGSAEAGGEDSVTGDASAAGPDSDLASERVSVDGGGDVAAVPVVQDLAQLDGEEQAETDVGDGEQDPEAPGPVVQEEPDMAAPDRMESGRYIVQVGAYRNFAGANTQFSTLEQRFADAAMMVVEYKGQAYHVVYLAKSATAGDAFARLRSLKREHGIEAYVIDISEGGYTPLYIEPPGGKPSR